MNDLVRHVEASIQRHALIPSGERVLVAVSGGVDSVVLLAVLHALASRHRWRLVAAHFNHQLRGGESDADEALVKHTAQSLGWPCVTQRGDVAVHARRHKLSTEMAARQLRHQFLARVARRRNIRTVALAHHADDQVELFFLRLLRGASCEGLAGMKWKTPSSADQQITLVRPLLDQEKKVLRAFAEDRVIAFREDTTNRSRDIQRNRLRHELLPLLRARYQPALNRVIGRQAAMLEEVADFLAVEARRWLKGRRTPKFATLHPAAQRAVLQAQLLRLGIEPTFDLIETLRSKSAKPVTVGAGVSVVRHANGLLDLAEPPTARFAAHETNVDLSGKPAEAIFSGVSFQWRLLKGATLPKHRPRCEFFDVEKVGTRIVLRYWRAGDRFHPIGLARPVKLQDWFTNQKVPRARRHEMVVAESEAGDIFWVEGQRIAEPFKVTATTRRRLRWTWRRE
ncbi:MAG: tRNA lysidine(34) synthetase TilS [Verrucomicrobia bacterium]|nr:tRNA lysidine(34) synthetase TilS [Verrucomicrobiota bacterium]